MSFCSESRSLDNNNKPIANEENQLVTAATDSRFLKHRPPRKISRKDHISVVWLTVVHLLKWDGLVQIVGEKYYWDNSLLITFFELSYQIS
ncbi:hypothetical protein WP50_00370 [Lactiplantibacillus plantarum]|nr:hypothetical protein WP50_00370 [Lactiplantibacillus plantarum]